MTLHIVRCPNVNTFDGLLTLMAVGNVVCFYDVLYFRADVHDLSGRIGADELMMIRIAYQKMMVIVLRNNVFKVEASESPSKPEFKVFHAAITRFARALLAYAVQEDIDGRFDPKPKTKHSKLSRLEPAKLYKRLRQPLEDFWEGQWEHIHIPSSKRVQDGTNFLELRFELTLLDLEMSLRPTPLDPDSPDLDPFFGAEDVEGEEEEDVRLASVQTRSKRKHVSSTDDDPSPKKVKV